MKFVASMVLLHNGERVEYNSAEESNSSPLAQRLFSFPFVTGVFISSNFVTVTKNDLVEWQEVFGELREYIANYLITGHPIFEEGFEGESSPITSSSDNNASEYLAKEPKTEIEKRIVELLEEYVRPAVESDGGAIEFNKYEEGKLTVVLKGSCSGCPSSTMTLKNGIQGLFNQMMPEVKEVVALEG
jgi:Fe-S cluster biogenesis protein NfuA